MRMTSEKRTACPVLTLTPEAIHPVFVAASTQPCRSLSTGGWEIKVCGHVTRRGDGVICGIRLVPKNVQ